MLLARRYLVLAVITSAVFIVIYLKYHDYVEPNQEFYDPFIVTHLSIPDLPELSQLVNLTNFAYRLQTNACSTFLPGELLGE